MRSVRLKGAAVSQPRRRNRIIGIAGMLIMLLLASGIVAIIQFVVGTTAAWAGGAHIDAVTFQREVDPASARFLTDAIDTAQSDGASMLLITLDTPGGDLASMTQITQKEINATVPIVVYVAPQEASAASAGTFIALAAPVVAMAPNTSIGAASQVDSTGANLSSTEDTKTKNYLEAQVTSNQKSYGRNWQDAVATVATATSFTETQALADHLINLEADSQTDLLNKLDGNSYTFANGTYFTLHTAGLPVDELQPTLANQLETLFLDPTVLFILFAIAAVCIYLELSHPGAIVPGTVGAIALIIFLLGAGSLSPNWAGLALMVLAIVLLAIDVRTPTHGVLTVGALISLVVGTLIFFDTGTDQGATPVNIYAVLGVAAGIGLVALFVISYAIRSRRGPRISGADGLLGQTATVTVPLAPEGRIKVLGEDWAAELAPQIAAHHLSIAADQPVRVTARQGLKLIVEPVQTDMRLVADPNTPPQAHH